MEDRLLFITIAFPGARCIYYAIAVLLGGAVWWIWKKPAAGLLTACALGLLTETVLLRPAFVGLHFQPELFWSWKEWTEQHNQILTNIVMFVPIGVLTTCLWKGKGILVSAGLSILIEVLQLVTERGLCEVDDVIHNCFGALIGFVLVLVFHRSTFKK